MFPGARDAAKDAPPALHALPPRLDAALPPSLDAASTRSSLKTVSQASREGPCDGEPGAMRPSAPAIGLDRRMEWLEEDVALLHRRLRHDCGEGAGAAGDAGLRALVARVDGALAAERHTREALEGRVRQLEAALARERQERARQFSAFSADLEAFLRGLIQRLDADAAPNAPPGEAEAEPAEARLRSLLRRVDAGLSAGAAALQDALVQGAAPPAPPARRAPDEALELTGPAWPAASLAQERLRADLPGRPQARAELPGRPLAWAGGADGRPLAAGGGFPGSLAAVAQRPGSYMAAAPGRGGAAPF